VRAHRRRFIGEAWLPPTLMRAHLAYAEQTFRSEPLRLVARIDRAYRCKGELTLVELKTRPRDAVYISDVIELSVQRLAVQDETGDPVSTEAWALVLYTGEDGRRKLRPHPLRLLGACEIAAMDARYRDLVRAGADGSDAQPAPTVGMCRDCGHRDRCSALYRDRPF
jgi:CRISPR-associated exonuclease Cas4